MVCSVCCVADRYPDLQLRSCSGSFSHNQKNLKKKKDDVGNSKSFGLCVKETKYNGDEKIQNEYYVCE